MRVEQGARENVELNRIEQIETARSVGAVVL